MEDAIGMLANIRNKTSYNVRLHKIKVHRGPGERSRHALDLDA